MNTKTFAQQSRALLMEGVANKLLYWGFNTDGSNNEEPNPVAGGYIFRGKVFDDETVPKLWKYLQQAIKTKGIDVVKEEAAYTWFNRIMALQIMAKNDYLEAQLAYVSGMANTPQILQKARQGQYSFLNNKEQERLKRIITDFSKEQEAFALLLVGYCHSNKMLNNVFGKLDDYTELLLPDNMLQDSGFLHLLNTTDAITDEQYKEVELIGWLYQFYISERKDEVFASFKKNKKAEAKDIPAATQIFTPNWVVKYMVQNTIGKIWLDKNPKSKIKPSLKYLVENESDIATEPIISEVNQLTLIDPAAGSGHILVEGFDLFYQMYMEEYYTPEEAVESILKNNLFGLDIDDRASQLATFAILLKAARQYRDVFAKGWLPNVYAMPEYTTFNEQEIKDFLGNDNSIFENELTVALRLMEQAKNLGSVMKLSLSNEAQSFVEKRFIELKNKEFRNIYTEIVYQKIKSFIPVLLILVKKYSSVVANPPYISKKTMNVGLKDYINVNYPATKSDLCTVFIEVLPHFTLSKGKYGFIVPPSWLFLSSYEELRHQIVLNKKIDSLLHLSRGIFGADFGSVSTVISNVIPNKNSSGTFLKLVERTFQEFYQGHLEELFLLSNGEPDFKYKFLDYTKDDPKLFHSNDGLKIYYSDIPQNIFLEIPGNPILFWISENVLKSFKGQPHSDFSHSFQGIITGDNNKYLRLWYEINFNKMNNEFNSFSQAMGEHAWVPYQKGGGYRKWYGLFEYLLFWDGAGSHLTRARGENKEYYFKDGISWSFLTSGTFGCRRTLHGSLWDVAGSSFFPNSIDQFSYLLGLFNSKLGQLFLDLLNPTMNYQVENILSMPINPEIFKKKEIVGLVEINTSISKEDWDSRESSWDFKQSPLLNESSKLEIAFEKWKEKTSQEFFQLQKNEEDLNSIFIKIYALQGEIIPRVTLTDITILQDELKKNDLEVLDENFIAQGKDSIELPFNRAEVVSQFISYAIGLLMGRYRLDKPGLNIAHPNPSKDELANYTFNHGEVIIDQDAILPIMGKNCNFNDDVVKQFTQLLDTIWGHEQRTENINFIQECLDKELEKFLVNDFWRYHCGRYKKTPIYWMFSSKKGAFQVLVYMHRMNEFTVEKIRANYLLEHLKYLKSEITQKEANASSLSTAEARQLDKLRADLIECEQYDMALKNIADQQIKFDLDDGVAKNYELFETVVAKIK